MTFDRELDLDNANVGMPEHKCMYNGKLPKMVVPVFLFSKKGRTVRAHQEKR